MGNLGTDPELRETTAGKPVCNFRMATNTAHGKGAARRDRTEWHRIVTWGRLAELCAEHLGKRSHVYVEGYLTTNHWEDSHGNSRATAEIVAEKIIFLDRENTNREREFDAEQGDANWEPGRRPGSPLYE